MQRKVVENIKFSLNKGTQPFKKRDSNIFLSKVGTEPPKQERLATMLP